MTGKPSQPPNSNDEAQIRTHLGVESGTLHLNRATEDDYEGLTGGAVGRAVHDQRIDGSKSAELRPAAG